MTNRPDQYQAIANARDALAVECDRLRLEANKLRHDLATVTAQRDQWRACQAENARLVTERDDARRLARKLAGLLAVSYAHREADRLKIDSLFELRREERRQAQQRVAALEQEHEEERIGAAFLVDDLKESLNATRDMVTREAERRMRMQDERDEAIMAQGPLLQRVAELEAQLAAFHQAAFDTAMTAEARRDWRMGAGEPVQEENTNKHVYDRSDCCDSCGAGMQPITGQYILQSPGGLRWEVCGNCTWRLKAQGWKELARAK